MNTLIFSLHPSVSHNLHWICNEAATISQFLLKRKTSIFLYRKTLNNFNDWNCSGILNE